MSILHLLAGSEKPLRIVDGADFDGTNDYMNRGANLTGLSDAKTGTIACYVRPDGGNGTVMAILANDVSGSGFRLVRNNLNRFSVRGVRSDNTEILSMNTVSTNITDARGWVHIMAAWDLATSTTHMYVDGVSEMTVITASNQTIDYTRGDFAVGAYVGGASKFNGCVAEMYFSSEYIDLSILANRHKFISASGKPVHLGTDGSLPTGTAPAIYLHIDDGEAVANFATNRGTGGNFSITGTLATASTSPSD